MSNSATPGWYHAQGDPAGTERYWDGTAWTEGPRPVGGAPDQSGIESPSGFSTETPGGFSTETPGAAAGGFGGPVPGVPQDDFTTPPVGSMPPAGAPQGGFPAAPTAMAAGAGFFPEESKATTALVLSIVGILLCGPLAFVGAFMGNKERKAIAEGRRDPAGQGKATAALVIGGIAIAITIILLLAVIVIAVLN